MPPVPRVVPWTSPEEHDKVYRWLYSSDPCEREIGVKRVKAWTIRGRVPHAISSTAAFVEVVLRDVYGAPRISDHELRMLYTMVFVRFVNGMVDPGQRSVHAISIAGIAARLGMPAWFVELRHAGTHYRLPSLSLLRKGCQQALGWLDDAYWTPQRPMFSSRQNDVRTLIARYKEMRKRHVKERRTAMIEQSPDMTTASRVLQQITRVVSAETVAEMLVSVLLEPGALVPAGKKKRASLPDLSVPESLLSLWTPMLRAFDEEWPNFGDELVRGMLGALDEEDSHGGLDQCCEIGKVHTDSASSNKALGKCQTTSVSYLLTLVAWIQHFLTSFYGRDGKDGSRSANVVSKSFLLGDIHPDDVLEFCLRKPNQYTRAVLDTMVRHDAKLRVDVAPFLRYIDGMLSMQTAQSRKSTTVVAWRLPTDEEMAEEIRMLEQELRKTRLAIERGSAEDRHDDSLPMDLDEVQEAYRDSETAETAETAESSARSAWTMHDPDTWRACPFGCLPADGGRVSCLDLPLSLDGDSSFGET